MKVKYAVVVLIVVQSLVSQVMAQTHYKPGYYIGSDGKKVTCFIKSSDWKNNPIVIETKKTEADAQAVSVDISNIQEFEITEESKYKKTTVQLDRSGESSYNPSTERNPIFKQETLLLKVLVEGEAASLLCYQDNDLMRFFYQLKDSTAKPLVYKHYTFEKNTHVFAMENNYFQQQLWEKMNCSGNNLKSFTSISYTQSELVRFVVRYNTCKGASYIIHKPKRKVGAFRIKITPGVSLTSYKINNAQAQRQSVNFGTKPLMRWGLEFEQVLPYQNNKTSIWAEPSLQVYSAEKRAEQNIYNVKIGYVSLDIPLGFRYYFFLNDQTSIFADGAIVITQAGGNITYTNSAGGSFPVPLARYALNASAGIGIRHRKFSLASRYYLPRELFRTSGSFQSRYQTLAFILGYQFM
jgi:hypothetical protein